MLPAARDELEKYLLGWVSEQVNIGMTLLKRERSFNEIHDAISYVNGEQFPLRSRAISRVTHNRLRKIALETFSSLTDVRPIWNYQTNNEEMKDQATILNKLARGWWKNSLADRRLQSVLMFACVGGSGYGVLNWNPDAPGGGDFEMIRSEERR